MLYENKNIQVYHPELKENTLALDIILLSLIRDGLPPWCHIGTLPISAIPGSQGGWHLPCCKAVKPGNHAQHG